MFNDVPRLFRGACDYVFAMDAKPKEPAVKGDKLPTTTPPVAGSGIPGARGGGDHAMKYPGSYGNESCFSKNPDGCPKHKTGIYSSNPAEVEKARKAKKNGGNNAPAAPKPKSATPKVDPEHGIHSVETGAKALNDLLEQVKGDPEKTKKIQELKTKAEIATAASISAKEAHAKQLIEQYEKCADPNLREKIYKDAADVISKVSYAKAKLAEIQAQNKALQEAAKQKAQSVHFEDMPDANDHEGRKEFFKKQLANKIADLKKRFMNGEITHDEMVKAQIKEEDETDKIIAGIQKKQDAAAAADKAQKEAAAKEAAANAAAAAPAAPPPPEIEPDDDDDEATHKAYHQKKHDTAMKALKEEWEKTGGKMSDGSGAAGYQAKAKSIKKDLKEGLAGIQKKFHPETPATGGVQPEPVKVTTTGISSDKLQAEVNERVGTINEAFQKAGMNTQVHFVKASPFATSFIFKHEGKPSHSQLGMIESKLGENVEVEQVKGKPDTWAVRVNNKEIADVSYSKMMKDESFVNSTKGMALPLCLGMGENGKSVAVDMCNMPHMLIAGTTGKGKSSVLNSALTSVMSLRGPDEIEVYCIDAKGTELGAYKDMPQVKGMVTGPDAAATCKILDDCIAEMEHRNEFFKTLGVKDLKGYNLYRKNHPEKNLPVIKPRLIAIDELAKFADNPKDLADVSGRIYQLGALARSAGINVLATVQDPVKTTVGDIKKNFPGRIAVKTNDWQMSKNIGVPGAENLTGKGDMYLKTDEGTVRIKGAFINDKPAEGQDHSELENTLAEARNKWTGGASSGPAAGGASQPQSSGTEPTGGGASPATEGTSPTPTPAGGGGTSPEPQPADGGSAPAQAPASSEHPTYPNTSQRVDLSHLGFFQAMREAIKLGWEGKKISYDPVRFNRMGADRWNAYVKKVQGLGKEPDYSEHHLSQIYPLPATATDFQKDQHKKWCAKFNEAAADPDPMKATVVKKQYLNWIKDEGLGGVTETDGGKKPNPYLASVPSPT